MAKKIIDIDLLRWFIEQNQIDNVIYDGIDLNCLKVGSEVLWQGDKVAILNVVKQTANPYNPTTGITHEGQKFVLLNIYPEKNGIIDVTYGGITKQIRDTSGEEEPAPIQVFFGQYLDGVDSTNDSDEWDSGTLTIAGDYRGFGCSPWMYDDTYAEAYSGITEITSFGKAKIIPDEAFIYCNMSVDLVIPNKIKSIGNRAFWSCSNLSHMIIGDGVTSIGNEAFFNSSLIYINIGNSVMVIGEGAFKNCKSLTSVEIPDSVVTLGEGIFESCNSLTTAVIGNKVSSISKSAFSNCSNLSSITIPDSVNSIGEYAFCWCSNLTEAVIGNNVKSIGKQAFDCCESLTTVVIGNQVQTIDSFAFYNCSKLTDIIIPSSVTTIDAQAFCGCGSLTTITIPDTVTVLGDRAFSSCRALTEAIVGNGLTELPYKAFSDCSSLTDITIGSNVTKIGHNAFENCSRLPTISLPESLTEISNNVFRSCGELTTIDIPWKVKSLGDGVFSDCTALTEVTIKGSVETLGNYLFNNCRQLTQMVVPNGVISIGDYAFAGCRNLTHIQLPESVENFGEAVFSDCSKLTYIRIPGGIATVPVYTFKNCSSLKEVVIPSAIDYIEASAFANCTALKIIYYCSDLESLWQQIRIESVGNSALDSATLYYYSLSVPGTLGNFWHYNEQNLPTIWGRSEITEQTAVLDVTKISPQFTYDPISKLEYANESFILLDIYPKKNGTVYITFDGLTKTIIDNSDIDEPAPQQVFFGTYLDESDTTINDYGMLTISGDYRGFGAGTYFRAKQNALNEIVAEPVRTSACISRITSYGNIEIVPDYAFFGCQGLGEYEGLPGSVTSIGKWAFYNCRSITEITIPEGVTSIGDYAFDHCVGLTTIRIPNNVTCIGYNAFGYCKALERIILPFVGRSIDDINNGANSDATLFGYIFDHTAFDGFIQINQTYDSLKYAAPAYLPPNLKSVTITGDFPITYGAFSDCSSLTEIILRSGAISEIKQQAFANCSSLVSIVLPGYMDYVAENAFDDCSKIQFVYFYGSVDDWTRSPFADIIDINKVYYTRYYGNDPNLMSRIWEWYWDIPLQQYLPRLKLELEYSLSLDQNSYIVSGIGEYASLATASVAIPPNYSTSEYGNKPVTGIAYSAFKDCSNLTSIEISAGIASIGSSAFENCSSLTSVVIPDSVTTIGSSAFAGCTSLTSIIIPDSVTDIGNFAFWDCANLGSVEIGSGITTINDGSFQNCTCLTDIIIPDKVTMIKIAAFSGCAGLLNIVLPKSLTLIDESAFQDCGALTTVFYKGYRVGHQDDWLQINISAENTYLTDATRYYYTEAMPTEWDNYWRYVNNIITVWKPEEVYYTITFRDTDGTLIGTREVLHGTTLQEHPDGIPSLTGWTIDSWSASTSWDKITSQIYRELTFTVASKTEIVDYLTVKIPDGAGPDDAGKIDYKMGMESSGAMNVYAYIVEIYNVNKSSAKHPVTKIRDIFLELYDQDNVLQTWFARDISFDKSTGKVTAKFYTEDGKKLINLGFWESFGHSAVEYYSKPFNQNDGVPLTIYVGAYYS